MPDVKIDTHRKLEQGKIDNPRNLADYAAVLGWTEEQLRFGKRRFETEVLASLLDFLPQSGATPDEIAALHEVAKRAVALTGIPTWPEELRKLRIRPDKRLPDGQKIETEVPEGLAKRKRRG